MNIIEEMKDLGAYTYVAAYYTNLTPIQLKDIALEAIYQLTGKQESAMLVELADRWSED